MICSSGLAGLARLAESRAPSASFAVIRGNDTLAYAAHGLANVDAWRAPTATTIYEIGSITKQFTSAAIMKLVEQGRMKLDEDLPLQGGWAHLETGLVRASDPADPEGVNDGRAAVRHGRTTPIHSCSRGWGRMRCSTRCAPNRASRHCFASSTS